MNEEMRTRVLELVLAGVFAGVVGAIAYVISDRQPEVYRAEAVVPLVAEAQVTSGAAVEAAREAWADTELRAEVVEPNASAAAARLSATAATSTDAVALVVIAVDELEAWDRRTASARIMDAVADLDARIEELAVQIRARQVQVDGGEDAQIAAWSAQREEALAQRERAAALAADPAPATLDAPRFAVERTSPRPVRNAAVAALAGAMLSVLLGFGPGRERSGRERAGRRAAKVRYGGNRPLAHLPRAYADRDGVVRYGTARDDELVVAVDLLRRTVAAETVGVRPRVILVAGAVPRSGATTVASLLAESYAADARPVLLVDADLRDPSIARRYGLNAAAPDLAGVAPTIAWLADPEGEYEVAVVPIADRVHLQVVPQFRPTRPAPGSQEALFSGFEAAAARWGEHATVIVDAAPIGPNSDTLRLLPYVAAVVLVVPSTASPSVAGEPVRAVRASGAPLLGRVLVDVPPEPVPDEGDQDADGSYPNGSYPNGSYPDDPDAIVPVANEPGANGAVAGGAVANDRVANDAHERLRDDRAPRRADARSPDSAAGGAHRAPGPHPAKNAPPSGSDRA